MVLLLDECTEKQLKASLCGQYEVLFPLGSYSFHAFFFFCKKNRLKYKRRTSITSIIPVLKYYFKT